jgi:hypothetical protein
MEADRDAFWRGMGILRLHEEADAPDLAADTTALNVRYRV